MAASWNLATSFVYAMAAFDSRRAISAHSFAANSCSWALESQAAGPFQQQGTARQQMVTLSLSLYSWRELANSSSGSSPPKGLYISIATRSCSAALRTKAALSSRRPAGSRQCRTPQSQCIDMATSSCSKGLNMRAALSSNDLTGI